jgi:hypothetical protein
MTTALTVFALYRCINVYNEGDDAVNSDGTFSTEG